MPGPFEKGRVFSGEAPPEESPQSKKPKLSHSDDEAETQTFGPEHLCDCTIRAGSTVFRAHKAVLSVQSTFFAKLFASDFKEGNSGDVDLPEDDALSIKTLLQYLYDKNSSKHERIHELATQLFPSQDDLEDRLIADDLDSIDELVDTDDADALAFDDVYAAMCFPSDMDLDPDEGRHRYIRRFKGLLKLMSLADKFEINELADATLESFSSTCSGLTRPPIAAWLIDEVFSSEQEPIYQKKLRRILTEACADQWLTGAFMSSPHYRKSVTSTQDLASAVLGARQIFANWHFLTAKCAEKPCLSGETSWSFYTNNPYWTSSLRCTFCAKQGLSFSTGELDKPLSTMLSTRFKCRHCLGKFCIRARRHKYAHVEYCIHCGTSHIDRLDADIDVD